MRARRRAGRRAAGRWRREPAGTRRGRLAGRVPEHAERHPAAFPQVGDGRAAALHRPAPGRRARRASASAARRSRPTGAPTRSAIRRSARSSCLHGAVGARARPGRAIARVRRSSRCGARSRPRCRASRGTCSATSTGTSRARKSGSRSTTSCPRSRSSSAVSRSAACISGVELAARARRERLASRRSCSGRRCGRSMPGRHHVEHQRASPATERVRPPKQIQWLPSSSCGARGTRPDVRLEAEEPAARGGDPDRAGAVGGDRGGHEPGGDRGRRAAAGAARRAVGVPRVAGHAPRDRLGERPQPELGHRRLADDDRAGRRAAGARPRSPPAPASSIAPVPRLVISPPMSISSLTAIGTPDSGPGRGWSACGQRLLGVDGAERVELRVEALDPLQAQLDQLAAGDLAVADELRLADETGEREVGHDPEPTWPSGTRTSTLDERLVRDADRGPVLRAAHRCGCWRKGWDNKVWLADERWAFRFPRRAAALPRASSSSSPTLGELAPQLPLPIPVPVFVGSGTATTRGRSSAPSWSRAASWATSATTRAARWRGRWASSCARCTTRRSTSSCPRTSRDVPSRSRWRAGLADVTALVDAARASSPLVAPDVGRSSRRSPPRASRTATCTSATCWSTTARSRA